MCNDAESHLLFVAGSMRRAAPVIVLSLLVIMIALGLSTVGNTKRDNKTVFAAIIYVTGGKDAFTPSVANTVEICAHWVKRKRHQQFDLLMMKRSRY